MSNGTGVSDHTLQFIIITLYTHTLSQGRSNWAVPHKIGLEGKIRPDRPDNQQPYLTVSFVGVLFCGNEEPELVYVWGVGRD